MSTLHSHLDDEVDDIVHSYLSVDTLHPIVSDLCQLPEFKQIFWDSLNHDFHVIRQRSQLLVHGEITKIQKAFAVLMQKNEDIIPAIDLYVDEILGLKFVTETEKAPTLDTMIQTRHSILNQALEAYGSRPRDLASRTNDGDEKLKRLFIVYHKARKDFDTTPAKSLERTKSAKFLRDTTENCLAYIAAKQTQSSKVKATCDGTILNELRATLEETIAIAEQGSGGKKRRFDENWDNIPQGPAKMRGAQPPVKSDPVPRGRTSAKKRIPTASSTQEYLKPDYPKRHTNLAGRRCQYTPHAERNLSSGYVHGDRYRPMYT